jgi:hypothetical protein
MYINRCDESAIACTGRSYIPFEQMLRGTNISEGFIIVIAIISRAPRQPYRGLEGVRDCEKPTERLRNFETFSVGIHGILNRLFRTSTVA